MPRASASVVVRDAGPDDLDVLVRFGESLRDSGAFPRRTGSGRVSLAERYADVLADPERRVVLAVGEEGDPLGMAIFVRASATSLLDVPALHVTHMVVDDRHRRRGAGRAIVAAAAAHAEEIGVGQVVVSVAPGSRDANRFYARLGFAPLVVRRVAPVGVLRRRLAGEHEQVARRRALGR